MDLPSAQRLSASEMKTHEMRSDEMKAELCSTPFGIRDENTRCRLVAILRTLLCSTPFGIRDENTEGDHQGEVR